MELSQEELRGGGGAAGNGHVGAAASSYGPSTPPSMTRSPSSPGGDVDGDRDSEKQYVHCSSTTTRLQPAGRAHHHHHHHHHHHRNPVTIKNQIDSAHPRSPRRRRRRRSIRFVFVFTSSRLMIRTDGGDPGVNYPTGGKLPHWHNEPSTTTKLTGGVIYPQIGEHVAMKGTQ